MPDVHAQLSESSGTSMRAVRTNSSLGRLQANRPTRTAVAWREWSPCRDPRGAHRSDELSLIQLPAALLRHGRGVTRNGDNQSDGIARESA